MLNKIEYGAGLVLLGGLSLINFYNYLLFHLIVELFSVIIAFGIASLVWHGRRFIDNSYYTILGVAYAFIGILDLLHAVSYKDMGILQNNGSNLPTQFWIAARYFESVSLFVAPFFITQKKFTLIFSIYSITFAGLLLSILWFKNFPTCYIEGVGLTNFKIFSEYIISIILLASLAHIFYRGRQHFDEQMLQWLMFSITTSIVAELFFTMYVGVYDLMNVIGHYFKFISYYCIYKAFIETSFTRPYNSLFRELQASEELFRTFFNLPVMGRAIISWQTQKWLRVNEKLYELLGHSKESLEKQNWQSLTHPEDWLLEKQKFTLIEQNCLNDYFCEKRFVRADGSILEAEVSLVCVRNKEGMPDYFVVIVADIGQRKEMERDREHLIQDLKEAIRNIQILQALLPICPSCYNVKDDHGYWHRVEDYINEYTPMKTEYTFCDKCLKKHYPELFEARKTVHQSYKYLNKIRFSK